MDYEPKKRPKLQRIPKQPPMGTQRELPLPENLDEPARLTARNAYNAIMIDRKGQKSEAHKKVELFYSHQKVSELSSFGQILF